MSPLARQVKARLVEAGTWVPRAELDALTSCRVALDDVLADLVLAGTVRFKAEAGYRLAGDVLARGAARDLQRRPDLGRAVRGAVRGCTVVFGVAERRGLDMVMYEMALPAQRSEQEAAQVGAQVLAKVRCIGD